MTGEELIAKLKELGEEYKFLPYHLAENHLQGEELAKVKEAVGEFYQASYERTGNDYDRLQIVIKFEEHKIYLALHAYYSSWDDSDFSSSEWEEVEPVQAIIYEPVRKKNGKA